MATLAVNWTSHSDLSVQSNDSLDLQSQAALFVRQMHSNRQPSPSNHQSSSTPSINSSHLGADTTNSNQQQQHPQIQQTSWTPSPMAAPFYPQFSSYFIPTNSHVSPHGYYDPTAAQQQFAQWSVYNPILFNGQQPQQFVPNDFQRNRTPNGTSQRSSPQITSTMQPDFYQQPYPFPTNGPNTSAIQQQNVNYYQGFHPYRRPAPPRQPTPRHNQNESVPFQPPYANQQNTGSSSSVNSATGSSKSSSQHTSSTVQQPSQPRQRVSSNTSSRPSERTASSSGHTSITNGHSEASRSTNPHPSTRSGPSVATPPHPHVSAPTSAPTQRRVTKPSPLSQDSTSTREEKAARRISRDDSDLAYATGSLSGSSNHVTRTGGLKGRLRRALAINNATESGDQPSSRAGHSGSSSSRTEIPRSDSPQPTLASQTDLASNTKTKSKPIFNLKFNASTDNISLSSTVSSASVMIRKIGSMGKIARRSSIAGITRLFKDKDRKKKNALDDEGDSGRGSKGSAAETRLTTATAELDRMSMGMDDMQGLSPAAQLVRQHTMKSKAQEDARQQALATQRKGQEGAGVDGMPATWDRGTAKRGASGNRPAIVNENGSRIFSENNDDDPYSGSDDDDDVTFRGRDQILAETLTSVPEHDDDDSSHGDEDVTIRMGDLGLREQQALEEFYEEDVPVWDLSRPNHRLKPAKGILRNAISYNQELFLENGNNPASQPRVRANSYTGGASGENGGPGPLADIPSPNPDHIDGLHKTEHQRSPSDPNVRLPDFSFEANTSTHLLSDVEVDSALGSLSGGERAVFSNPALNSSAPVLSMNSNITGAPLVTRSTPTRHISFAATLSIYDTFAPTIYDRRCEPVTCNRLTPALAQRIKEELNTYKMEEMEVHAASRVHTHFFV